MNNPGELTDAAWGRATTQDMHEMGLLRNVGLFARMPAGWLQFDRNQRMMDVRNDEPVGMVFLENWHMGTYPDPCHRDDPRFGRRLLLDAVICNRVIAEAGCAIEAVMQSARAIST
jgi:hypothetical protein